MTNRHQCYVIEYSGGYWSANQGRIRHITDAQLYSLRKMAQEIVDELDSSSCAIKPVWVEWETDRQMREERKPEGTEPGVTSLHTKYLPSDWASSHTGIGA